MEHLYTTKKFHHLQQQKIQNHGQPKSWRAPSRSSIFNALCTFHHTAPYIHIQIALYIYKLVFEQLSSSVRNATGR